MQRPHYVWRKKAKLPPGEVQIVFEDESHDEIGIFVARVDGDTVNGVRLDVIGGGHLTHADLQRFPWRKFMRLAVAASKGDSDDQLNAAMDIFELPKTNPAGVIGRPGRKGHPIEHYQRVADLYRKARGQPNPARLIGDAMYASASTARGWIAKCRELGLLPPVSPPPQPAKATKPKKTQAKGKKS